MAPTASNNDDLVQGTVKFLKSISPVLNVVSTLTDGTPMIFQDDIMWNVEKGLTSALVVSDGGPYASANLHNTMRSRRILLEIWIGPELNVDGSVKNPAESRKRAEDTYHVVDKYLFRPYNKEVLFGTLRTIACDRLGDYVLYAVDDSEYASVLRLEQYYGVHFYK